MHIPRDAAFFSPFSLQLPMRRKKLSSRQSKPAAKRRNEKPEKQPIRRLTASDDLGVLFSRDQEDGLPDSFADALASGIPATTLAEILTEKEELPTPAQSLQGAIRNSPPPQDRLDLHGCTAAEARLAAELEPGDRVVLVNHWPLRQEHARLPLVPRFMVWCGTRRTEDWHTRFPTEVVVYGHLHIPQTQERDGVRFEEVSFGYPRNWEGRRTLEQSLRLLLAD